MISVDERKLGCSQYIPLLQKYDWNVQIMLGIMKAESGCNPQAFNKTDNHHFCLGSMGLFQIGCDNYSGKDIFTPEVNIREAYYVYKAQSLKAWTTYTNGAYKHV